MRRCLLILLCVLLLTSTAAAATDTISDLEARVEVALDGTCRVTVTAKVQFVNAPTQFVFPLGVDADDIAASGASYEEEERGGVECVVFKSSIGFSGTQTFVCSYTLPCTMTESASGQHFTLQIPQRGFDFAIANFDLTVTFPSEVTALPTWESAYYSDVIDNYLAIQVTENTVTASSDMEFKDHETLTMKLRFDPDTFDLRHLPGQTASVDRMLFLLLLALSLGYWFFRLRGRIGIVKPLQAVNFESGAGEIPCQMYADLPDMGAMLAHWGNLGYVTIHRTRRGRIIVEKQMEMGNERKSAERRLFDAIFRTGASCDTQSSRFLEAARNEGAVLKASWLRRLFKQTSGSPKLLRIFSLLAGLCVGVLLFDLWLPARASRWFWLPILALLSVGLCFLVQNAVRAWYRHNRVLHLSLGAAATVLLLFFASQAGCMGYMFFNLALQVFCGFATRFGGQRSTSGEELLRELLGLRSFLRRADNDVAHRLLRSDSQYFYRMLPYAEMFGVGKRFIRRFGDGCKSPCRWLSDARGNPRTAAEFYALYSDVLTQIRLQARLTRKNTPVRPAPRRREAPRRRRYARRR